ncbi:hypothetical protein [Nostoc sp. WHI]|uniref:hypothetical protein n=1 Tax=Nostoc sp. WHI TaxID=2650611 RepID=UPI0018C4A146|nr:hypothetical protein [Nostoc sp. WHI]
MDKRIRFINKKMIFINKRIRFMDKRIRFINKRIIFVAIAFYEIAKRSTGNFKIVLH